MMLAVPPCRQPVYRSGPQPVFNIKRPETRFKISLVLCLIGLLFFWAYGDFTGFRGSRSVKGNLSRKNGVSDLILENDQPSNTSEIPPIVTRKLLSFAKEHPGATAGICKGTWINGTCIENDINSSKLSFSVHLFGDMSYVKTSDQKKYEIAPVKLEMDVELIGVAPDVFTGERALQCDNGTNKMIFDLEAVAGFHSGPTNKTSLMKLTRKCLDLPKGVKLNANLAGMKMWIGAKQLGPFHPFLPLNSRRKRF